MVCLPSSFAWKTRRRSSTCVATRSKRYAEFLLTISTRTSLPFFSPALFTLQETAKFSHLLQEYQDKITKTQARVAAYRFLADDNEYLGQCTNMANFAAIREFFDMRSFDEIEKRVTKIKIGYAVAQALDTSGVPFHKDFKGTFPSLNLWAKMDLEDLHKEIAKSLQIGVKRSYAELVDSDVDEEGSADLDYDNEDVSEFTEAELKEPAAKRRKTKVAKTEDDKDAA